MRTWIMLIGLASAGCGSVASDDLDVAGEDAGDASEGDANVPDGGDEGGSADADADGGADADTPAEADAEAGADADTDADADEDGGADADTPAEADAEAGADADTPAEADAEAGADAETVEVRDVTDAVETVEAGEIVDVIEIVDGVDGDARPTTCYLAGTCGSGFVCDLRTCPHPPAILGTCIPRPGMCPASYDPVCGCDGTTYGNDCNRQVADVGLLHGGACGQAGVPVCDGFGDGRRGWWDFHSESEWSLYCEVDCAGCTPRCAADPGTGIEGWYANCTSGTGAGCMPNGLIVAANCM